MKNQSNHPYSEKGYQLGSKIGSEMRRNPISIIYLLPFAIIFYAILILVCILGYIFIYTFKILYVPKYYLNIYRDKLISKERTGKKYLILPYKFTCKEIEEIRQKLSSHIEVVFARNEIEKDLYFLYQRICCQMNVASIVRFDLGKKIKYKNLKKATKKKLLSDSETTDYIIEILENPKNIYMTRFEFNPN